LWGAIFFTCSIMAQTTPINSEMHTLFLPQGFVLESLGGYGYTNVARVSIFNISSGNPASLIDFRKPALGVAYQSDSGIKDAWLAGTGHKRIKNDWPQSYGLTLPVGNFRIGYGFRQRYNTELDFGKMEITTVTDTDGTGKFFTPIQKTSVISHSLLASYSIPVKNVSFSLGVRLSGNKLDYYQKILTTKVKHNDNKESWSAGLRIDKPNEYNWGLFFENGLRFKKLTTVDIMADSGSGSIGYVSHQFYVTGDLPDRLHAGGIYWARPTIQLTGNVTYIYWNRINEGFENQLEYSGSVVHRLTDFMAYSVGFYYTNRRYRWEHALAGSEDNLMAAYLTGGLVLRVNVWELELAVADSHLFSGDWRKQTIGKVGLGVRL
ncbi:MAG: hypothetical protein ACE5D1_07870, partial [Fidelibacterota bacterium]